MGAAKIFDFGDEVGAGTATKLIGNFMIIANFALLEEAFAILKASGVDPKPTLEMLTTIVPSFEHLSSAAQLESVRLAVPGVRRDALVAKAVLLDTRGRVPG